MDKQTLTFSDKGEPSLCVLSVPGEFTADSIPLECFCVPVLSRTGGILLNLPRNAISEDVLIDSLEVAEADALIGPSKGVLTNLCYEDDENQIVVQNVPTSTLVVDFSDSILECMREYDPAVEAESDLVPFSKDFPSSLLVSAEVVVSAKQWIEQLNSERVFYSAREDPVEPAEEAAEVLPVTPTAKNVASKKASQPKRVTNAQVLDQLSILVAQVKSISARQDALEKPSAVVAPEQPSGNIAVVPPVSAGLSAKPQPGGAFAKYAKAVGPPPKVRAPTNLVQERIEVADPSLLPEAQEETPALMQAISQQSSAMLALVSHLAGAQDSLTDLQIPGLLSTTTKGVQKRERMQSDLASGSSTYYLQMMQQLHKRLHPAKPLPKTESELSHLSFLEYLEKTGGYRNSRETGLILWLVGHIIDAAALEDLHMVKERLALLAIALEQSSVDKGDWGIAYLLSLASDPLLTMFQDRTTVVSPFNHPFSSLVPPSWATAVLAYVKELEVLSNKKSDTVAVKKPPKNPADPPSPKRKQPRFPKAPKGDPAQGSQ